MKSSATYSLKLDAEELSMLRDLVRIGMRSKYYQDFANKECHDDEEADNQHELTFAVHQFINLLPVSMIESVMDKYIFEGVQ